MSVEKIYICDNCNKQEKGESYDQEIILPLKWICIERLKVWFNAKKGKAGGNDKFRINISDEDPDFCCKKCAIEWFIKQINKICK